MSDQETKIMWSRVALVVVVIVVVAALGAFVLLRREDGGKVRFYSKTYFYLIATEDNGPLESVVIAFPDPNIDNKALEPRADFASGGANWTLYAYLDNVLIIEVRNGVENQLVAPRTSKPENVILESGKSPYNPVVGIQIDNLFPSEILVIEQWWEIPADKANQLTLRASTWGNASAAGATCDPAKRASFSFSAELYRYVGENLVQKAEAFGITDEELVGGQLIGWWELTPI